LNAREHGRKVAGLFDNIAGWYDFLNHFLSAGQDIYWRYRLVHGVRMKETGRILDLAAGTLDVSLEILRQHPGARVLAMDFSRPMLVQGKDKITKKKGNQLHLAQADGRSLPLPDASVDCVTIAFGIRNILPRREAYEEILRVLVPGGRLCILEFGTGRTRIWKGLYNVYLNRVLPLIGRVVSRDPSAYKYLADTITGFPAAGELAEELYQAGFSRVQYAPMCSGIVYLHTAEK
jgi:demethylmenaquinone methyltransferase/2-methoxy-6-polyprenyl-1,4-benzoquinol methylase